MVSLPHVMSILSDPHFVLTFGDLMNYVMDRVVFQLHSHYILKPYAISIFVSFSHSPIPTFVLFYFLFFSFGTYISRFVRFAFKLRSFLSLSLSVFLLLLLLLVLLILHDESI